MTERNLPANSGSIEDIASAELPATETLILSWITDRVLCVTLNRPEVANAFNTKMAIEVMQVFESISMHVNGIRCVIVTGSGSRAFCAGGDLKERQGMTNDQWSRQHLVYERMLRAVINCPHPVIGAVNGAAFAGGLELAAACDFIYAVDSARFALTETSLGIIPGAGGTQTLTRAIGSRRAKELILGAIPFSAADAESWGLVNQVVASEDLMDTVTALAIRIAANAPIAVRQAKQSIRIGADLPMAEALAFEIEAYNRCVPTQDRQEGVDAFNEKRKPDFTGS